MVDWPSDTEFARMFTTVGASKMAEELGVIERAVYRQRRVIEKKTGTDITAPSRVAPERSARIEIDLPKNARVLIGSDAHYWPGEPSTAHLAFVKFIAEQEPNCVIMNGDAVDGASISRHPPIGWEGSPTLKEELEVVQERLGDIELETKKGVRRIWTLGNHDCLDGETECLTRRGWKRHESVRDDDEVFSLDTDTGQGFWTSIDEVVRYPYSGELYRVECTRMSMAVTPNHRVLGYQLNWRTRQYDRLGYHKADDLPYSLNLPMAAVVENGEYPLEDDELRLAGWVITDGCYDKHSVNIYQSKPDGIEQIAGILDRLKITYSQYTRAREARVICGREPVGEPLDSVQFRIRAVDAKKIKKWLPCKKLMPPWAQKLSARQFEVLLDAIVAGDGVWDGAENGNCAVVYGRTPFLDSLQAVALQFGWRARVAVDNRGHGRLCLARHLTWRLEKPKVFNEPYEGTVWCLRVPPGNFMVRRKGAAYFTGNSRFETKLASVAPEYREIVGVHLKDHFPHWEPCWSVFLNDDVVVKHRFKGGMHAPQNNTLWSGRTMVTGHLHSQKVMPITDYNGTRWGVDTGCMADPLGPQFVGYTEDSPLNWRQGFCMLTWEDGRLLTPELIHVVEPGRYEFRGKTYGV